LSTMTKPSSTRTHPHLQSLHATQNALTNLIKKINAMDNPDAYTERLHAEERESELLCSAQYNTMSTEMINGTPENTPFSSVNQNQHRDNSYWDNPHKSKIAREKYQMEHGNNRFHAYYRQFLDLRKLDPLKKVHQHERRKFGHIAENFIDYVDNVTSQLTGEINSYGRKARMEDSLLEKEGNVRKSPMWDSIDSRRASIRSGDPRDSFHFSDTSASAGRMDDQYAYSSNGSPLNETMNSNDEWDSFKETLKEKDRKRREKLRTRAAIIDLKQRKNRDKTQGVQQDMVKRDIQNRLVKLQEKQRKSLERSRSRSKSRQRSRSKSPRASRTNAQENLRNEHNKRVFSPGANASREISLPSPRRTPSRKTPIHPPSPARPEVRVARRRPSNNEVSPARSSPATKRTNVKTGIPLIKEIDALL